MADRSSAKARTATKRGSAAVISARRLTARVRRAGPAILASGGTVILGLLTLLVAELNSTKGMGPVLAIGIAVIALDPARSVKGMLLAIDKLNLKNTGQFITGKDDQR